VAFCVVHEGREARNLGLACFVVFSIVTSRSAFSCRRLRTFLPFARSFDSSPAIFCKAAVKSGSPSLFAPALFTYSVEFHGSIAQRCGLPFRPPSLDFFSRGSFRFLIALSVTRAIANSSGSVCFFRDPMNANDQVRG